MERRRVTHLCIPEGSETKKGKAGPASVPTCHSHRPDQGPTIKKPNKDKKGRSREGGKDRHLSSSCILSLKLEGK